LLIEVLLAVPLRARAHEVGLAVHRTQMAPRAHSLRCARRGATAGRRRARTPADNRNRVGWTGQVLRAVSSRRF
jgi:hypothetical protein